MEAYNEFAWVYDTFMDNVDYNQWCNYAIKLLNKYGAKNCPLVDVGCGTGTGTMLFAKAGYYMTGIDLSQNMLEVAENKKQSEEADELAENNQEAKERIENIAYVLQDITEMELPYTVPAMVSIGDSMNYITDYGEFAMVLNRVHKFLEKEGVFVFDLKTRKYFSDIGEKTIAEDREECSFIWENYFDEETDINEYYLSVFIQGADGRYDKYEEEHFQRGYTLAQVRKAVEMSGLKLEKIYEAFSDNEGTEDNDRVYVVVRKQ